MALGFLDRCVFTAASAGTGDFVVSAAVTGYLTPSQASAVDGTTYRYFAQSDDLSEWEVGSGAYTSGTTTLARTTIEFSSNSNNAVDFTAAPKVYMGGPLARDMHWEVIGDTTISSPVASVTLSVPDPSLYSEIKFVAKDAVCDTISVAGSFGFVLSETGGSDIISKPDEIEADDGGTAQTEFIVIPNTDSLMFILRSMFSTDGAAILDNNGNVFNPVGGVCAPFFCDTTGGLTVVFAFLDGGSPLNTLSGKFAAYGLRI